jgi:uncharacterized protein with HEPN domain
VRKSELFLKDILVCVDKIERYVNDKSYEEFCKDDMVIDAVVRLLEIIGEAVSNISSDIKQDHPEIPWQNIKDFRNVVTHKYWKVDHEIIWDIIENKLDPLKREISKILE